MRIYNNWQFLSGFRCYSLASIWFGARFFGFSIGPLALEWTR
jgi:hypothetical protein